MRLAHPTCLILAAVVALPAHATPPPLPNRVTILYDAFGGRAGLTRDWGFAALVERSEEHTSELQSLAYLVCRLLLEKKKKEKARRAHVFDNVRDKPAFRDHTARRELKTDSTDSSSARVSASVTRAACLLAHLVPCTR